MPELVLCWKVPWVGGFLVRLLELGFLPIHPQQVFNARKPDISSLNCHISRYLRIYSSGNKEFWEGIHSFAHDFGCGSLFNKKGVFPWRHLFFGDSPLIRPPSFPTERWCPKTETDVDASMVNVHISDGNDWVVKVGDWSLGRWSNSSVFPVGLKTNGSTFF